MTENFPFAPDHFCFECTQCADCCTGDQTVLLNLFDLYKLARFLKLKNTGSLFTDGWLILQKDETHGVYRPQIRFKTAPFKFCPFLINEFSEEGNLRGWCQLHPAHKPLVCALSPIGTRFDPSNHHLDFLLVPPTTGCPGLRARRSHHLKDYVRPYQEELEMLKSYFKILESCKALDWSAEEFKHNLYSFNVEQPFKQILTTLSQRYLR